MGRAKSAKKVGMSSDEIDAAALTAGDLLEPRAAVREAALERLKSLYVSCEGGVCTTSPEVARLGLSHATRALLDPDPEIRVTGVRAIELFAADGEEAVPDLARLLEDSVGAVRLAALEALCEFGGAAAPVVPQVAQRLLHASSPDERCAAADCLGNADIEMAHVDALLHALANDLPAVQACAAHALGCALESARDERRIRASLALKRGWRGVASVRSHDG